MSLHRSTSVHPGAPPRQEKKSNGKSDYKFWNIYIISLELSLFSECGRLCSLENTRAKCRASSLRSRREYSYFPITNIQIYLNWNFTFFHLILFWIEAFNIFFCYNNFLISSIITDVLKSWQAKLKISKRKRRKWTYKGAVEVRKNIKSLRNSDWKYPHFYGIVLPWKPPQKESNFRFWAFWSAVNMGEGWVHICQTDLKCSPTHLWWTKMWEIITQQLVVMQGRFSSGR